MDAKSKKSIFLGYSERSKGYIVQDTESSRVFVSRDVVFLEDQFISTALRQACEDERQPNVVQFFTQGPVWVSPTSSGVSQEVNGSSSLDREDTTVENQSSEVTEATNDTDEYQDSERSVPVAEAEAESSQEVNDRVAQLRGDKDYLGSRYILQSKDIPPVYDITGPPLHSKRQSYYRTLDRESNERLLFLLNEPEGYRQAMESLDSEKWQEAMESEMQSLLKNQTWDLVELPPGRKVVDCKWVYKIKPGDQGCPDRYKARLCARGFTQVQGVDFDETYSPVVKYTSIRVFLVKAVLMKMVIHQMDVVTAFLNAHLDEDVFMKQPPGFEKSGKKNLVCKLKRSLYGLKQSPRQWNKVIDDFLKKQNFKEIDADCCIYIKISNHKMIMVSLYVDDLMIASNCDKLCLDLK
jgi:hypothetical protein